MPISLQLPDGTSLDVESDHPIVLLGPNGVGKTRFAVDLANRTQAERISANRYIGLANLPRQADSDLKANTENALNYQRNQYWEVHNEYTFLMSQILEEDKSKAQEYRTLHMAGAAVPETLSSTRLMTITRLWEELFPGRTLKLDYEPTVRKNGSLDSYPTARMSEGERTALYLITRLVSSTSSILIVDEPEVHFHPLLARRFWNAMESHKKDTLFIYVTHDIPFALSRNKPVIWVIRSPASFDQIEDSKIPSEAINTILGAASFSINASRLVFCEGGLDDPDHRLLKAWYACPNTAVIPVGGCERVRQCVDVFNEQHATKNVIAIGHIDRDDWSDEYLAVRANIRALPINEIEGIVCYGPIFKALATYYGHSDVDQKYAALLSGAQNSVKGVILNKHALNRAKLILELKQQQMRNSVMPDREFSAMKAAFLAGVTTQAEAEQILDAQLKKLETAMITDELLKMFPAKTYRTAFQPQIGVSPETALELICAVLVMDNEVLLKEESKAKLKAAVINALECHFFERTA